MKGSTPIGPVVGVVVGIVFVAAFAILAHGMAVSSSEAVKSQVRVAAQQGGNAGARGARGVQAVPSGGNAARGRVCGGEFWGYLYCSHGQPEIEDWPFQMDLDVLCMLTLRPGSRRRPARHGRIHRRRQSRDKSAAA